MKWLIKSLIGLLSVFAFIQIYSYVLKGATFSLLYGDLTSILGIIVITAIANRINYSIKDEWGYIKLALQDDFSMTPKKIIKEGALYFCHLEKLIFSVAIFMSLWAIVSMMANLEDSSSVGPNLAVSILVIVYSILINILLVHPMQIKLKRQSLDEDL